MDKIKFAFANIKTFEKILMLLTLLSVVFKHIFQVNETVDIFVGGLVLGALYFPLGFYFLQTTKKDPVPAAFIAGFVYALGLASMLYGTLKVDLYVYAIVIFFVVLFGWLLFLKNGTKDYSKEFVYSHYFRSIVIGLLNLLVLL